MAGGFRGELGVRLWKRLDDQLGYDVELALPGFSQDAGKVWCASPVNLSAEEWFSSFWDRFVRSIGREYLPVYRMNDGEFAFCVGRVPRERWKRIPWRLRSAITGERIRTLWGEEYSRSERKRLLPVYAEAVREVAEKGYVAAFMTRSRSHPRSIYFKRMCGWFAGNGISLDWGTYVPFFFVYPLVTGAGAGELFRGRRLAIVSGLQGSEQEQIAQTCSDIGVRELEFVNIPRDGCLGFELPENATRLEADVVFVAGGIGSADIIWQLRKVRGPVIDVGGRVIEMLKGDVGQRRLFMGEIG